MRPVPSLHWPRPFTGIDSPVTKPTSRSEPRPRSFHRCWTRRPRRSRPPAIEPRRRRAGIKAARSRDVLTEVLENIHQAMTHLTRRGEPARVIPLAPDRAAATKHAVDRLGRANREPLAAARQGARVVRFDEQMQVIRLHAELKYPEARARGRGERAANGFEHAIIPKG